MPGTYCFVYWSKWLMEDVKMESSEATSVFP